MRSSSFVPALCLSTFLTLSACSSGGGSGSSSGSSSSSSASSTTSSSSSSTSSSTSSGSGEETRFTVSGTISGADGVVTLSLNEAVESFEGESFTFSKTLDAGDVYTVQFVSADGGQDCEVAHGGGMLSADVSDVEVTCTKPFEPFQVFRFDDGSITGQMVTGEFNGDAHKDIAFMIESSIKHSSGAQNGFVRMMYGDGAGGFTQGEDIEMAKAYASGIYDHFFVTSDVNGDGIDDLLFREWNDFVRIIGQAGGAPIKVTDALVYNQGRDMFLPDATGDGTPDIVSRNGAPGNDSNFEFFAVFPGNGDGTFEEFIPSGSFLEVQNDPEYDGPNIYGAQDMTVADFDGDGDPDILALSAFSTTSLGYGLFKNDGAGNFAYAPELFELPADLITGKDARVVYVYLIAEDIDRDGDMDFALASLHNFVQLMMNDGAGNFTLGERLFVGQEPYRFAFADFNKDERMDMVSVHETSNTLAISWGYDGGKFGQYREEGRYTEWKLDFETKFGELSVMDMDGNDYPDITFAESGSRDSSVHYTVSGSIQIIFNPGN